MKGHSTALLLVGILCLPEPPAWAGTSRSVSRMSRVPAQAVTPSIQPEIDPIQQGPEPELGPEVHPFGIRIEGSPSARINDAKSTVTCPENTYAVKCFCKDRSNCDGAAWESATTCTVYNTGEAIVPSIAVAVCSPVENFAAVRVTIGQPMKEATSLFCPRGFVMTSCAINDPYSNKRQVGFVNDFRSCVWTKLSGAQKPNPLMSILCVKPHGPLFLGPPKDRPGPPFLGEQCKNPPGILLTGTPSERANDAPSTVTCPANTFAVKCFCKDKSNCDGAKWISPSTCTVRNAADAKVPSVAVAKCTTKHRSGDVKIVGGIGIPAGQRIFCPPGFGMGGCAINDPFSQHRETKVINDGFSCYWMNLSFFVRKNPTLTGLCVKPLLRFGKLFQQGRRGVGPPFPRRLQLFGPGQPRFRKFPRRSPFFGPPLGKPRFRPFPPRPPFFGPPLGPPRFRPFPPGKPCFGRPQGPGLFRPFPLRPPFFVSPQRQGPPLFRPFPFPPPPGPPDFLRLQPRPFFRPPSRPRLPPLIPGRPFFGSTRDLKRIIPFPKRFPFFGDPQGMNPNRPDPPLFGPHGLLRFDHPFAIQLTGQPTALEDDAPSSVSCPAHTFAAKCHCDDFRNCDGSMWETPSKCTVRNAFGATAQSVPMVRCAPILTDDQVKVVKCVTIPEEKLLNCPKGFMMLGCAINDPWSQDRKTNVFNNGTHCYWMNFGGFNSQNPTLTAICRKEPTQFGALFFERFGSPPGNFGFLIQGLPSAREDMAPSFAVCPAGTYVTKCFCADNRNCAGAMWTSPSTCKVKNAVGAAVPSIAKAGCLPADLFADVKVITAQKPQGEEIKCPEGYRMPGCNRMDPFSEKRIGDIVHDAKSCLWVKLSGSEKPDPTLTAVCYKFKQKEIRPPNVWRHH